MEARYYVPKDGLHLYPLIITELMPLDYEWYTVGGVDSYTFDEYKIVLKDSSGGHREFILNNSDKIAWYMNDSRSGGHGNYRLDASGTIDELLDLQDEAERATSSGDIRDLAGAKIAVVTDSDKITRILTYKYYLDELQFISYAEDRL